MKDLVRRIPGLGRLLQALGVNAVPAAGFFGEGWSIGTTLLLYWIETIVVILLVSVRIVLHRRWTRKTGHWNGGVVETFDAKGRSKSRRRATLLSGFLGVMIPFTAAHGVFVTLLAFMVLPKEGGASAGVSLADLKVGAVGMAVFLLVGFAFDLVGLRERSFAWIERVAGRAQGRMLLTHLTIIFGMFAMAALDGPVGLFLVFAGFKLLADVAGLFVKDEVVRSPEPPKWISRLGPGKDGQSPADAYRESVLADRKRREANELVAHEGATDTV